MQSSRFTVTVPNFPETGKHLLYNTISQAQIVIDEALKAVLGDLPLHPEKEDAQAALAQMKKMGFLVDSEDDDSKVIENHFKKVWQDTSLLRATVLTTYSCNFECVYCVEEGVKKPVFMDEKMSRETAEYIKENSIPTALERLPFTFMAENPF